MKHLLKKELKEIIPKHGGGISGEVHLIKDGNKKYIVRICKDSNKPRQYEKISKKLEKYKILPKFLGKYKNYAFFEYLEGRNLSHKETLKTFKKIGKIVAQISKLKTTKTDNKFPTQLKELTTGKFSTNFKVDIRRYREKLDKRRIKPLFTKEKAEQIKKLHDKLSKTVKPKNVLDANDVVHSNFRLSKGKIYFVDLEAIKPKIKGFGIAKCFSKWAKTDKQQQAFKKGYEKADKWFFEKEYADLCYIRFLIQALNYKCQVGRNYKKDLKKLNSILKKYDI
jgi:hypothetical protein